MIEPNATQKAEKPKSKYAEALKLASRMLQAKLIRDERTKKLCVCLEYIFDNGDCPVHGKAISRVEENKLKG